MASLKRVTHKSGRVVYRIVISLGYDGQGNKRVKNLTCPVNQSATPRQQEKEALKYAMDMEDKIKYGYDSGAGKIRFEDFAREWLEDAKQSVAYGTYVGYEQLLRSKILPYFQDYKVISVRSADVEAFYASLTGEYAPGTVRRAANVLNCIFKAAVRRNIIENNPCQYARKPKGRGEDEKLRYFTPHQSLMFLKSLDLQEVPSCYRMFYRISVFCGCRKGELLALRWKDIDWERRELSISGSIGRTENGFAYKEPKSRAAVRKIPLPEILYAELREYRGEWELLHPDPGDGQERDESLFLKPDGKRIGHTGVYQYFVRHLRRHNRWVLDNPERAGAEGLEELPLIPLHGLRHSCATLLNYLDVNMVDISKYLGHANCHTTMNIYAHSFEAQKREACKKLDLFLQTNL